MFKRIVLKFIKPINRWLYPVAARKSCEEWYQLTEYQVALEMIATNPESAEILAQYVLDKYKSNKG